MTLTDEIVACQEEVKRLKSSQILGGNNTVVFHKLVEFETPNLVSYTFMGNTYYGFEQSNPQYSPSSITGQALVMPDDPYTLMCIEKIEVMRGSAVRMFTLNPANLRMETTADERLQIWSEHQTTKSGGFVMHLNLSIDPQTGPTDHPTLPVKYKFRVYYRVSTDKKLQMYTYEDLYGTSN